MKTQIPYQKISRNTFAFLFLIAIMTSGTFAQKETLWPASFQISVIQQFDKLISVTNHASGNELFEEETLPLENWMIDLNEWVLKAEPLQQENMLVDSTIIEEDLKLESWMTETNWMDKKANLSSK